MARRRRDGKKVVKRKPPEHNYVHWDLNTYTRLMNAPPEPLVSRFQVTHGMLLNVLSRRGDGCRAMQRLIRDSHEPEAAKPAHRRRGWQLFRALVARGIVEIVPPTPDGAKVRVNLDLQEDFSMDHALSLYLLETIPLLDPDSPGYALDLLTLVESILENPELILRRQLDRLKDRAMAEMKADGVEYEQRMEELDKLEYPKPLRDFVYNTFNAFADRHPWVGEENIRPKSIAREMFETYKSFAEYILEYDLERSEGLLLRHLNSVYKVLSQTVPDQSKTDDVLEIEWYFEDDGEGRGREPGGRVGADARSVIHAAGVGARRRIGGAASQGRGGLRHHAGPAGIRRRHSSEDLHRVAGVVTRGQRGAAGGPGWAARARRRRGGAVDTGADARHPRCLHHRAPVAALRP